VSLDEYEQVLLSLASIKYFFPLDEKQLKVSLLETDIDDLFLFTNFATLSTLAEKKIRRRGKTMFKVRNKTPA
jgi:hypothetical protein